VVVSQLTSVQTPDLTSVCLIKAEYSFSGGDAPVDSEAPMVTSSVSRFNPPNQSFEGAHRG
jgi:hypothetical protein